MVRLLRHKWGILVLLSFVTARALLAQTVEVKSDCLFVNSKKLTNSTTSRELQDILGKPDRTFSKVYTIWTYDDRGLRIYLSPKTLLVHSFEFDLVKDELDFSPKKIFHGVFTINNHSIAKTTSTEDLSKIKDIDFHHSALDLYTATTAYLTLTFEISDDNHQIQNVALSFKE